MKTLTAIKALTMAAIMSAPTLAYAQDDAVASPQNLPPPQSHNDPRPPVPAPAVAVDGPGITQQAGVGGTQAYARAGVLELGGNIGFNTGSGFTAANATPTVGWFIVDNVQLSALLGFNYSRVETTVGGVTATAENTYVTALAEPSVHLPLSDTLFVFGGVGAGLAYAKGPGAGFALAPRLGLNVMVGRSGILTPALNLVWSTTDVARTPDGAAVIGVSTTFGASAGYTVMW